MPKELSQAMKDRISAGQKDAWKDPSKRIYQKKRVATKRLLKDDDVKKLDEQGLQILLDVFIEYFFMRRRRPLREILNILEKAILTKVLSHVNGNQRDAAKFLNLKYTTLHEKVKKHNIKFFKSPIAD